MIPYIKRSTSLVPSILVGIGIHAGCIVGLGESSEGNPSIDFLVPNSSFETDLKGWAGWQSTLSRVALPDAPDGSYVAKVTHSTGDAFSIYEEPPSFTASIAGKRYMASAWVRAASASSSGKRVQLRIRERRPGGEQVAESSSAPLALTDSFQRLTVSMTAAYDGDSLDIRVSQSGAASGDAFYVDLLVLEPTTAPPLPAPEQRPFDPQHPVYQPIPANCPLYVHSSAIVSKIASQHRELGFDTGRESAAVFVGKPTDPTWKLTIQNKQYNVRAPDNIRAGTGYDYPLVLLDPASAPHGGHPVEYRLWQANINRSARTVTSSGGGIGVYANDGRSVADVAVPGRGTRALGMAEIFGQNTGSGNSYTVGMIRPIDVQRGRIDHAIRVAIGYPHSQRWFWPANRTEQQAPAAALNSHCPMGCRIFLDPSVDVNAVADRVAARLSHPKHKAFARMVIVALQEYGMIALDGTTGSHNIYMEGDASANWDALIGPKNAYGSYNDIARAISAELPWERMRIADGSVFEGYGR